jgi:hypothetical protein
MIGNLGGLAVCGFGIKTDTPVNAVFVFTAVNESTERRY